MSEKKKKIFISTIVLIVLLVMRVIGQVYNSTVNIGLDEIVIGILFIGLAITYVGALVGIVKKQTWAPALVATLAIIDGLLAIFYLTGEASIGALVFDILLIFLALQEKKRLEDNKKHDS